MAQSTSFPIYAIPGMGVDSRIFKELRLDQEIHFLEWDDPFGERESLSDYAQRFAVKLPEEPFILLGLSFGGILAQEISRFKPVEGIILLSSIRDESGLPWHMKLMQWVPYYHLSRGNWRIKTMPLWGPFVGLTDPKEIQFLQEVFAEFSAFYRMWAIRSLVHWQRDESLPEIPLFHIHGSKDEIFPVALQQADIVIDGGTHSMVFQRAEEVSAAIEAGIRYIARRT